MKKSGKEPKRKKLKVTRIKIPNLTYDENGMCNIGLWRAEVFRICSGVPLSQLSKSNLSKICKGFFTIQSGYRFALEWRVDRILKRLPVTYSSDYVLGAHWNEPKQIQFIGNHLNQQQMFMSIDLFKNVIFKRADGVTKIMIMMTCKRFYIELLPFMNQLARETFGKYGRPMHFTLDAHLKWLQKNDLINMSRIKEQLGIVSTIKANYIEHLEWNKSGYIEYLRNTRDLIYEQEKLKFIEQKYIKFETSKRIEKFNYLLKIRGLDVFKIAEKKKKIKNIFIGEISPGLHDHILSHFGSFMDGDEDMSFFDTLKPKYDWLFLLLELKGPRKIYQNNNFGFFSALKWMAKNKPLLLDTMFKKNDYFSGNLYLDPSPGNYGGIRCCVTLPDCSFKLTRQGVFPDLYHSTDNFIVLLIK